MNDVIEKLATLKRNNASLFDYVEHECSKKFCNPISLPVLPHVYMCNYGRVHVCSEDMCDALDQGVCRITGACHGFTGVSCYDKMDHRTWRVKTQQSIRVDNNIMVYKPKVDDTVEPVTKKRKRYKLNTTTCKQRIQNVIIELLYGTARKKINENKTKYLKHKLQKKIDTYIAYCESNNIPVNLLFLSLLHDDTYVNYEMLTIEEYNLEKLYYYQEIVFHFITLMRHPYINVKVQLNASLIKTITLSIMYKMIYGYSYKDIMFLPQDSYLMQVLPNTRDLHIMNFNAKCITKGNNLIEYVYGKAISSNLTIDELQYTASEKSDVPLMRAVGKRNKK